MIIMTENSGMPRSPDSIGLLDQVSKHRFMQTTVGSPLLQHRRTGTELLYQYRSVVLISGALNRYTSTAEQLN